jgi:uncharacterized BrkB/YihY/UPF0761 family membrane protein
VPLSRYLAGARTAIEYLRRLSHFFGLVAWVYFIAQAILGGAVCNRALKDVRQR